MESANRVPFCLSGYDAFDIRWVVPVPGLTGFAITSRRSHNLLKLISSAKLLKVERLLRQHANDFDCCFRHVWRRTFDHPLRHQQCAPETSRNIDAEFGQ